MYNELYYKEVKWGNETHYCLEASIMQTSHVFCSQILSIEYMMQTTNQQTKTGPWKYDKH